MCLISAKLVLRKELLVYKLIARRKDDGTFVSPMQKTFNWIFNRMSFPSCYPLRIHNTCLGDNCIGEGAFHTLSTTKPTIHQIIDMAKNFPGNWFYGFMTYNFYELGIIQCKLRGTIYEGRDELDNHGYASTDVELIPETYKCLFRSYEEIMEAAIKDREEV